MKVNSSSEEDSSGKHAVPVRKADSGEYCPYPLSIVIGSYVFVGDDVPGHVARHPEPRRLAAFSTELQLSREAGVNQPSGIPRVEFPWSWVTLRVGSGHGPRLSGFGLVSTTGQS